KTDSYSITALAGWGKIRQRATKKRLPEVAQLLREFSGSGGKAGFSRSPQDVLRNEAHQS
ncbi:MAG: hypothetical protein ABTS16_19830, partial [Candidatus Accumulibacter phosphatis]